MSSTPTTVGLGISPVPQVLLEVRVKSPTDLVDLLGCTLGQVLGAAFVSGDVV